MRLTPPLVPWIDERHAEARKIFNIARHIARHERQVVFQRGGGNEPIGRMERQSLKLAFAIENAPAFCYRFAEGKDAVGEPGPQFVFQPASQVGAAVVFRMDRKALTDFADADDAQIHQVIARFFEPSHDTPLRLWTG